MKGLGGAENEPQKIDSFALYVYVGFSSKTVTGL
jgi:hypothetical protein